MKKSQLYHLIHHLIQESKETKIKKNSGQKNLANKIYQQYLVKNKLITRSKGQKMKDIMKGFQALDSYIDLNDIINSIQGHITSQMISQEKQSTKKKKIKFSKTKTQFLDLSENNKKTLRKAEDLLKKQCGNGMFFKLNNCEEIVQKLQSDSCQINNVKYKNYSNSLTFHQLLNKRYTEGSNILNDQTYQIQELELESNEKPEILKRAQRKKTPWEMLQDQDGKYQQVRELAQNEEEFFNLTSLNTAPKSVNNFDISKLLHSATVYLHMILEKEHNKKWAQKEKKELRPKLISKKLLKTEPSEKTKELSVLAEDNDQSLERGKQNKKMEIISENDKYQNKVDFRSKFHRKSGESRKQQIQSIKYLFSKQKSCKDTKNNSFKSLKRINRTEHFFNDYSILDDKISNCVKKFYQIEDKIQSEEKKSSRSPEPQPLNRLQKKPRHTLGSPINIEGTNELKRSEKQRIEQKWFEQREIRKKFTFKKRKVKQGVLKKITQFVNDVQFAERNMKIHSKTCQKQLNKIQNKMEFQFNAFKSEKFLTDDKALDGIRCALSKISNRQEKYQK